MTDLRTAAGALALACLAADPAMAVVDEIHFVPHSPTSVAFSWRGGPGESRIELGTSPGAYTLSATGTTPSPKPDSSPGPFYEALVSGLAPNTVHYYRIAGGRERSFRTPPAPGATGWWFASLADIGSSDVYPTVLPTLQQAAADNPTIPGYDRPRLVLVPGDLTYGDKHSLAVVDRHFNDAMETFATWAGYLPAWGNHDWGGNDGLDEYEGRFLLPNSQTAPGSSSSGGGSGDDWYWLDYGNVRFIAFPEPFKDAWEDWETKAATVMAAAEAKASINHVVVFGHRPAYSTGSHPSAGSSTQTGLQDRLERLRAAYTKFRLVLFGHSHHYERTCPVTKNLSAGTVACAANGVGLVAVTTGSGGAYTGPQAKAQAWTAHRRRQLHATKFKVSADRIEGFTVCGPDHADDDDSCSPGDVIDRFTVLSGKGPTRP